MTAPDVDLEMINLMINAMYFAAQEYETNSFKYMQIVGYRDNTYEPTKKKFARIFEFLRNWRDEVKLNDGQREREQRE